MKFGFEAPVTGPLATPESLVALARRGEELGFDLINAGDHIVMPKSIGSAYPYTESGEFAGGWTLETGATAFLEQLTVLTFLAGVTSRLRLLTAVMVVPYRSPVFTAKTLATLDVMSNGRLDIGCGLGWMREEFEALGAPPFEERGAVSDEYILAFKELWTSDSPEFDGKYVSFSGLSFEPKPLQKPHPPLWIGGESVPAMRRAARVGDVWYPFGNNPRRPLGTVEQLSAALERLNGYAEEAGRDPATLRIAYSAEFWYDDRKPEMLPSGDRRIFTGEPQQIADDVHVFENLGVDTLMFNFQGDTLQESLDRLDRFATEVRPLI